MGFTEVTKNKFFGRRESDFNASVVWVVLFSCSQTREIFSKKRGFKQCFIKTNNMTRIKRYYQRASDVALCTSLMTSGEQQLLPAGNNW